ALERGIFVDGAVQPVGAETLQIVNPGTGEVVGQATKAGTDEVDAAVRSAHAAFADWSRRGYADRGDVLPAGAEAFRANAAARIELRKAAETLEHYAGLAKEVRAAYVHGLDPGVDGRVLRKPLGVVAAIVPWNFPTTLLANKLGPALVCGNTVVAKPADTTPF